MSAWRVLSRTSGAILRSRAPTTARFIEDDAVDSLRELSEVVLWYFVNFLPSCGKTADAAAQPSLTEPLAVLAPPAPPLVTVTAPGSTESWEAGKSYEIVWTVVPGAESEIVAIEIELWKDGAKLDTLAGRDSGLRDDVRSYRWAIPTDATPGRNYQLKVIAWDSLGQSGRSFSPGFSIVAKAPPTAEAPSLEMRHREPKAEQRIEPGPSAFLKEPDSNRTEVSTKPPSRRRISKTWIVAAALLIAALLTGRLFFSVPRKTPVTQKAKSPTSTALAGGRLLYQDDFATFNPGWGAPGELLSVKDGKLIITPASNRGKAVSNQSNVFDDADATVEATMSQGDDLTQPGGLIFWGKSYNDYYCFLIKLNGSFAIYRWFNDRWLYPIAWRNSPEIKTAIGQVNKLRVVTKGRQATAYINDKEVATFSGQPPPGGGCIGLYGESAKSQNIWQFSNLRVTIPE